MNKETEKEFLLTISTFFGRYERDCRSQAIRRGLWLKKQKALTSKKKEDKRCAKTRRKTSTKTVRKVKPKMSGN